jgi:hypothetical protein
MTRSSSDLFMVMSLRVCVVTASRLPGRGGCQTLATLWGDGARLCQVREGEPQHFLYLRSEPHQQGPLRGGGQARVCSG